MKQGIRRTLLAISGTLAAINVIAQWSPVSVPTNNNLNSISLLNETSGWIVGDKGTMLYLDNGSWVSYPAATDQNLYSVCLLNESDGWAVGSRGTILHLKDNRWIKVSSPTRQDLHSVSFNANGSGYAAGKNGTFLYYSNGNWEMADRFMSGHLYAVAIKDDLPYLAGGRENITVPIVEVGYNGSYRFTKIHDPGYYEITGLAIQEDFQIWAVGKPGIILHNDGIRWEKIDTGEKLPSLTGVYFPTKDIGIIVGYGGTILTYTSDGWQKEDSQVNEKLNGTVISGSTYYAIGNSGTVLQLKRDLPASPEEEGNSSPLAITSFPNPSSGFVNITIPDKTTDKSFITVLNSRGQTVIIKELENGRQGSIDQVSTTGLSNGLYVVNIISGGQIIASGKFIVKH